MVPVAVRTAPPRVCRSIANAASPVPGLQKQPVRSEIRRAALSRATIRSSTTVPAGSSRLSATVPPRSSVSGGP